MTTRRIVATCTLCGHEYTRLFDSAESTAHLAEAHGLHFDPKPLGHYAKNPAETPGHTQNPRSNSAS